MPRESAERAEVFARIGFAHDGEQRLRGESERVGDGDADALGACVEC